MDAGEVAPSTERSARKVARAAEAAGNRPRAQRKQRRKQRRNKFLRRKIDNVATEESLQKRGARRFPLRESGGRAAHYYGHEAGEEISRGTGRVHGDRQI